MRHRENVIREKTCGVGVGLLMMYIIYPPFSRRLPELTPSVVVHGGTRRRDLNVTLGGTV